MRINQWIAHNTSFSRREADNLIKSGRVKIARNLAKLSDSVENERIFIDGREVSRKDSAKYTLIVYHKPKNEIVSKRDDRGRRTIYDGLEARFRHFMPIGRLDFASSGLLILSDSANIARILMQSQMPRIYNLKVSGIVTQEIVTAMSEGLSLKDARAGGHKKSKITAMDIAPFCHFEVLRETHEWSRIKVGITEGKNRELRRFFAHFGLEVLELKRVSYGFIHLNALPCGKSRFLTRKEYKQLREFLKDKQCW